MTDKLLSQAEVLAVLHSERGLHERHLAALSALNSAIARIRALPPKQQDDGETAFQDVLDLVSEGDRRELVLQDSIIRALYKLDGATPRHRNGPCIQAANILRAAVGLEPLRPEEMPSSHIARANGFTARATLTKEG